MIRVNLLDNDRFNRFCHVAYASFRIPLRFGGWAHLRVNGPLASEYRLDRVKGTGTYIKN